MRLHLRDRLSKDCDCTQKEIKINQRKPRPKSPPIHRTFWISAQGRMDGRWNGTVVDMDSAKNYSSAARVGMRCQ